MFFNLMINTRCFRKDLSFGPLKLYRTCCSQSSEFITDVHEAAVKRSTIRPMTITPLTRNPNRDDLQKSITARNYKIDTAKIQEIYNEYRNLKKLFNYATKAESKVKNKPLDDHKHELRQQCQMARKKYIEILDVYTCYILRLPNLLHHSTPMEDVVIHRSNQEKPSFQFSAKSHQVIGGNLNELEFLDSSPFVYYLKDQLSLLEMACSNYFSSVFEEHGFVMQTNPDVWKAVIFEGSGVDHNDRNQMFCLNFDKDDTYADLLYLVGGGSIVSSLAFFTKGVINEEDLPHSIVVQGKSYDTVNNTKIKPPLIPSLYNTSQSTVVSSFTVLQDDINIELQQFDNITNILFKAYNQLGIHFEVVKYSPTNLRHRECYAIGFRFYSPSLNKYIEIGRVSSCGYYMSERLQAQYRNDQNTKNVPFVRIVCAEISNVTKLIGLIIENTQNEQQNYSIPSCIKPFML